MTNAERTFSILGGKPKVGGGFMCPCPAHDDEIPSLSVDDDKNGKLLVKCMAGCTQDAVIHGLKDVNAWPDNDDWTLSPQEQDRLKKEIEHDKTERLRQKQAQHIIAAKTAAIILGKAGGDPAQHPYTIKKGIPLGDEVKRGEWPQKGWRDALLVPIYSIDKTIVSIQAINVDGCKDFLKGGRIKGCFYPLGKIGLIADSTGPIFIGEGLATMGTVVKVIGSPGIMALTAGNLTEIAIEIKKVAPASKITIIADDDQKDEGGNPGVEAAMKAALAVGGKVAIPNLGKKADAWDVLNEQGAEAVRQMIAAARMATAPDAAILLHEEKLANLLQRVTSDCGAPFEPETVKMLAMLKTTDKSRFMQVRDQIKRSNSAVIISELDRDISRFYKRTSSRSSSPSFSSLSNSYPSLWSSLDEKVLHFQGVLVSHDENENNVLVNESIAAALIAEELHGYFSFDATGGRWLRYTGSQWRLCLQLEFDTAVTELLYVGTDGLGFKNSYQSGVAALLQKGGQNRLADHHCNMIPFLNGLLDLSKKTLQPITPDNAATWVLPFHYTHAAQCPNFLKWLQSSVDHDFETMRLLQAWLNALLTGRPDLQIFLHLIGPAGTGKSTFGRLVFMLVGRDNATTTTLKQLETNRFEAANIYGKRLVAIEEADKYGGSINMLKAMTGQDPLRLERKNQQQQGSFIFGGQTLMMSNERLATTDYTSGIERRRITVEFKRRITPEERTRWNTLGGEEILLHKEAPGIINWALSLTGEEVSQIFKGIPERVKLANFEAARFNNPVFDWMMQNLIPDPESKTKIGIKQKMKGPSGEEVFANADVYLYPNYLTWCLESGREAVSLQRFSTVVIDAANSNDIDAKKLPRSVDGVKIQGLRIRNESEPFYQREENRQVKTGMKDNLLKMKEMKSFEQFPVIEKGHIPSHKGITNCLMAAY
jgi:putative DNA primase/helicase